MTTAKAAEPKVSLREILAYSSALFGLLCLIKVYAVARYSTTTTVALITTAPEDIILGTLAVYVYPTMATIAYGAFWASYRWRGSIRQEAWLPIVAVAMVTALMTPVKYHAVGLAVLAASVAISLLAQRLVSHPHRATTRVPASTLDWIRRNSFACLASVTLLAGFLNTLSAPWTAAEVFLPKEAVITATQALETGANGPVKIHRSHDPVVAYMIEETLTSYTILDASTRYVIHLEKTEVKARYACHAADVQLEGRRPLADVVLGRRYRSPNSNCYELAAALKTSPR